MEYNKFLNSQLKMLNSEDEAKKNSKLDGVTTTLDKKPIIVRDIRGGSVMKTRTCNDAYLDFIKNASKTPTKMENKPISPPQNCVKNTPSNGVSSKPVRNNLNLPIYEDEDFDKPIEERVNCVQSPRWEDLGIEPLLKTDLYKDILENIPEVKNKVDHQLQKNQSLSSLNKSSLPKTETHLDSSNCTNSLINSWNNGATSNSLSLLKDLYDDIEPITMSNGPPSLQNPSISIVPYSLKEDNGNSRDVDDIKEGDESGTNLSLEEEGSSIAKIELTAPVLNKVQQSMCTNDSESLQNCSTTVEVKVPQSLYCSEYDSNCKPPVLDCYPKENLDSVHSLVPEMGKLTTQVGYGDANVLEFAIVNDTPPNLMENEKVTLDNEIAPILSLESYVVAGGTEQSTSQGVIQSDGDNIYLDVQNANILVENLPSDVQYVQLDLSAVQALQEHGDSSTVSLKHLILEDGQLRLVQSSGEEIIVGCVKDENPTHLDINQEKSLDLIEKPEILNQATSDLIEKAEILNQATLDFIEKPEILNEATSDLIEKPEILNQATSDLIETPEILNQATSDLVEKPEILNQVTSALIETPEILNQVTSALIETPEILNQATSALIETPEILNQATSALIETPEILNQATPDLIEKPEIFNHAASDLIEKPEIFNQATSDLIEKPEIFNQATSDLIEKPEIFNQATSDLIEKPEIFNRATSDLIEKPENLNQATSDLIETPEILNQSTSDLIEKPEIFNRATSDLIEKPETLNQATSDLIEKPEILNQATSDLIENPEILNQPTSDLIEKPEILNQATSETHERQENFQKTNCEVVEKREIFVIIDIPSKETFEAKDIVQEESDALEKHDVQREMPIEMPEKPNIVREEKDVLPEFAEKPDTFNVVSSDILEKSVIVSETSEALEKQDVQHEMSLEMPEKPNTVHEEKVILPDFVEKPDTLNAVSLDILEKSVISCETSSGVLEEHDIVQEVSGKRDSLPDVVEDVTEVHNKPSEEIDLSTEVTNNFEIVAGDEIPTEVVLSHSQEDIIKDVVLSQSERFYRKYIPGLRIASNPVYDNPESSVVTSGTSDSELDNAEKPEVAPTLPSESKPLSNTQSFSCQEIKSEIVENVESENQFDAMTKNFSDNILKNVSDESQTSDSSSLISQKENGTSMDKFTSQVTIDDCQASQADNSESSETKERLTTKEQAVKRKYRKSGSTIVHGSSSEGSGSPAAEDQTDQTDQPVRRSSRIKSLEEKREKQREFNRKKDPSKHKKSLKKVALQASPIIVTGLEAKIETDTSTCQDIKEPNLVNSCDENNKSEAVSYTRQDSTETPFHDTSSISPIIDPRRRAAENDPRRRAVDNDPRKRAVDNDPRRRAVDNDPRRRAVDNDPRRRAAENDPRRKAVDNDPRRRTVDNDPGKPEKVKSRWRRNSEMERVHSNSPNSLPLKVLNNNNNESYNETVSPTMEQPIVVFKEEVETEKEKMPQFEIINENIYLFERKKCKSKKEVRRMACDCTLTKEEREEGYLGCLDDCLNRLLMIECGSRCMLGNLCANKRFTKKENANAAAFKTEKKGWGLKAMEHMESGTFIMEYVGEVLSSNEFNQRVKRYSREKRDHYYFMALKGDEIIDATLKGNISRFINHSCDPNCETQKWTVNGELRIGFFTRKDVKPNEELTFDYQFQRYGREAQKCYCDSSNCRGFIGEPGDETQLSLPTSDDDDDDDDDESEPEPDLLEKPSSKVPKVSPRKKRIPIEEEVKKKEEPEDFALEKELEKLSSIGGLKNREQTLMLNRVMVRAETRESRQRLLDIIQNTSEQACLRLFLDYHGLTLLWSWMVDLGDDAVHLKKQILEILTLLPISNKTILLDSKVLSVVQRWAIRNENQSAETEKTGDSESLKLPSKEAETPDLSSGTPSGCATPILNENQNDNNESITVLTEPTLAEKILNNDIIEEKPPAKRIKLDIDEQIPETVNEIVKAATQIDIADKSSTEVKDEIPELPKLPEVSEVKLPEVCQVPEVPKDEISVSSPNFELISAWSSIDDELDSDDICLADIVVCEVLKKLVIDVCDKVLFEDVSRPIQVKIEGLGESVDTSATKTDLVGEQDDEVVKDVAIKPESECQDAEIPMDISENTEPLETHETTVTEKIELPEVKIDIPSLAQILLDSWSSLKEIFRIPRLEHQKRKQDELAASSILSDRERDSRDYYDSPSRRIRDWGSHRRDRSPRGRESYDDGHERKSKKFMPAHISTRPKLSKEQRRQLFELEVQQRDNEENLRRQKEYLAKMQAMELANAQTVQATVHATPQQSQEYMIPTVYDSGEHPNGPHPDYVGNSDYTQSDYPIEFAGQVDYAVGSYEESMDYTVVTTDTIMEYTGPPPDYAMQSYVFDPLSGTYQYESDLLADSNSALPDFPEPPPALIEVYPPPSGIVSPKVSFIPTVAASKTNQLKNKGNNSDDEDDDDDDDEDQELAELDDDDDDDFQPRTIQPSLLRPTASSPAPKPISPYPSPIEDQSPAYLQSPDYCYAEDPEVTNFMPIPGICEVPDIPSPSQIPLPASPPPDERENHNSPPQIISSPVAVQVIKEDSALRLLADYSPQTPEASTPMASPLTFASPLQLTAAASPTVEPLKLPRPTPNVIPISSLIQIPLPDKTPTPEAIVEQLQAPRDEAEVNRPTSPTPLPVTISYDTPSLIHSLLQKVKEAANLSPASPLQLPHNLITPSASVAISAPQITSPAADLMSPVPGAAVAPFVPGQPSPFVPVNPQGAPLYYVQPSGAVIPITDQTALAGVAAGAVPLVHVAMAPQGVEENLAPPVPAKPKRLKLPPSWKTAKDGEGNIYYYHSVTRQTQWDPPEGTVEEDEPPMEPEESPMYEEAPTTHHKHSKRRTTTAAADTSSELAKRIKELFRSKMSSYIVQCLNPYRKSDCKVGRITNTDDFKHLARKLTHFVMAKELKHCKTVEDLDCNENVKHKAKDFVHKYMGKFGAEYKKEKTLSPRDY